jgi:predicted transcriptional regulator
MTNAKALEALARRAARLPESVQADVIDAMAQAMNEVEATTTGVYKVSADERAGIERGLADVRAGRFASDEEIASIFARVRASRA